jgi:hypothetical protein
MERRRKKKLNQRHGQVATWGEKERFKMEQSILWFVGFAISLKLHSCTLHLKINLNLKYCLVRRFKGYLSYDELIKY